MTPEERARINERLAKFMEARFCACSTPHTVWHITGPSERVCENCGKKPRPDDYTADLVAVMEVAEKIFKSYSLEAETTQTLGWTYLMKWSKPRTGIGEENGASSGPSKCEAIA